MKFEASQSILSDAIQLAFSAIPNKTTLQVLNNFLLQLEENQLKITATDLDMTIIQQCEVQGHQDGAVVVNARKLLEVVRELPDFPVLVSVDEYVMTIQSESGFQANLAGFDAEEYPGLPEMKSSKSLSVPLKDLKFLAEKTLFAVSSDTGRRALMGVNWQFQNGQMIMVATDGHRLGKAWLETQGLDFEGGCILPPKSLNQVLRISKEDDAVLQFELSEASAKFGTDTTTVYTKLIEGPYPNYENVIPKSNDKVLEVNREQLGSVLRRVATMAHSKSRQVKFQLSENKLILTARNQDLGGDSEESLDAVFNSEPMDMAFNAGYLLEELRMVNTEDVLLKISSSVGAVIVEPKTDSPNYFFIVMPLRIVEEQY